MPSPWCALGSRFAILLFLCAAIHIRASAQTTATWDNSSGNNWSDPLHWSSNPTFPDNGNPGAPYSAVINSGAVTVDSSFTINALAFAGGQILGSGDNTLTLAAGVSAWSGGSISGELSLLSPATFNISGDNTDTLINRRIRNNGVVVLVPGSNNFRLGNAAVIENRNGGLFDLQNNGTFLDLGGGFGSFLNNSGATLRKSIGSGTSSFNLPLTNSGTVDVQTGTLALNGGGIGTGIINVANGAQLNFGNNYDVANGANFTGPGFTRLIAGTLSSAGAVTANRFEIAGGTLSVVSGGTFTIASGGILTFSNGAITGAGTTNVANGGTLTFNGDNTNTLSGTTLNNAGLSIVSANSNNLRLGNGAQIQNNNGGIFDLQNDGAFLDIAGGFGRFTNHAGGTLRKSVGTGVSTFNVPLTNNLNATIDVQTGTLNLTGGGSSAGNFNVAASAVLLFNSALTLNTGATLTGAGVFRLPGSTLTINGAVSSENLDLVGGTLSVAPSATFTIGNGGTLSFSNGTINGAGNTNVASGGLLNINGDNTGTLNGTTLNNSGIITLASDSNNFRLGNGALISNNAGGIFDLKNSGRFLDIGGGFGSFTNNGGATLRKSAGTGLSTFNLPLTNNLNGVVSVQTGTLAIAGGGTSTGNFNVASGAQLAFVNNYTLNAGTTFTGDGFTLLSGGTLTVDGQISAHRFQINAGTLFLNAPAVFNIASGDTLNFGNGTISGPGETRIAAGGALNISGDNTDTLNGTTVANSGTITLMPGSNNLRFGNAAVLQNKSGGEIDLQNDGIFNDIGGGFGSFTNELGGTLRKSAGTAVSTFNLPINNIGTVAVQSGTLSVTNTITQLPGTTLTAGTWKVLAGAALILSGAPNNIITNQGDVTLSGIGSTFAKINTLATNQGAFSIVAGRNFTTVGGLDNSGAITVGDGSTFTVPSGTFANGGTLDVRSNGTFVSQTAGFTSFSGGTLTGGIYLVGGTFKFQDANVTTNAATITLDGPTSQIVDQTNADGLANFANNIASGNFTVKNRRNFARAIPFTNAGNLIAGANSTLTFAGGGTNTGTLTPLALGTIEFSGGTFDFNAGTNVTGAGTIRISGGAINLASGGYSVGETTVMNGTVNINAPATTVLLNQSSGILNGTASMTVTALTTWTGGSMNGTGTTNANGGLTISGADKTLNFGRTLISAGTTNFSGGTLFLDNGSRFMNNGTFNALDEADIAGGGTAATFTTSGTVNKSGAGTTTMISRTFVNGGTINADSGTLAFTGDYSQTAGSLRLNGGNVSTSSTLNLIAGSLQGTGIITGNVANSGSIQPGFSAGRIDVAGDLTLGSNSNLVFEIGGAAQGTQYDFLTEAGTTALNLNGTLTLNLINNFDPVGFSFTIVSSNANLGAGQFSNVAPGARLNVGGGFGSFLVEYGSSSDSVVLRDFQRVPEPTAFVLFVVGAVLFAGRASQRRLG